MLHRMTTLLSTVVIAFLATLVLNAVFSTSARAADSCLARPTGSLPHGSHGYYQTNRITHRKCWVPGAKKTTIRNIASPPVKLVAPETQTSVLPPAVADANARFEDTFIALRGHAAAVAAEVANENLATSRFESRWNDLSDQAHWIDLSGQAHSSDPQSNPVGQSGIHQPVAVVPDDVTKFTKASGHSYAAGRLPNVTLMVLLVSLGGALALFALIGRSFLFARPARPVWPHIPPRDDIFRVPSDLDTWGPSLASTAKPADVRPDGADGRHPDERDVQVEADALLREIGESQIDVDLPRGQRRASYYQRLANPFAGLGYPDDSESR
jgi:hypothetical protein